MRVFVVHHPGDQDFVETLVREMERRGFDRVARAAEADVALLLVSRAALQHGLGSAPREALEAGIDALPVLLGDDAVPLRFPVHRKHTPLAKDVATVMKHLVENRKQRGAHQVEGKRELFGYGVLLALVLRA